MVELMSEQKFDEYALREFKLTNTKVSLHDGVKKRILKILFNS
jgi:hypothetical protein